MPENHEHIAGSLEDIGFVCIESKYNGKWVLCFHSFRQSWEVPGGHVEKDEMPLAAAKRELYEETGAVDYDIIPVWDFQVFNEDGTLHNNGRTYFANIRSFEKLPECSEMEKVDFFEELPENVTYKREKMIKALERAEKLAMAHYI
jgi:8-oxo-dGTP diphosphatase